MKKHLGVIVGVTMVAIAGVIIYQQEGIGSLRGDLGYPQSSPGNMATSSSFATSAVPMSSCPSTTTGRPFCVQGYISGTCNPSTCTQQWNTGGCNFYTSAANATCAVTIAMPCEDSSLCTFSSTSSSVSIPASSTSRIGTLSSSSFSR